MLCKVGKIDIKRLFISCHSCILLHSSQGKELYSNQHQTEDLSCLPSLTIEDIPLKQEQYEVSAGPRLLKGEVFVAKLVDYISH